MWQKINKIIKTGKTQTMVKITQAAYICEIAGRVAAGHGFEVVSFHNNILTISIKNNVLAQELKLQESQVIEETNRELKGDLVKKIKYRIGG